MRGRVGFSESGELWCGEQKYMLDVVRVVLPA